MTTTDIAMRIASLKAAGLKTGLSFTEIVKAAKETGCRIRRAMWSNAGFALDFCKDDGKYYYTDLMSRRCQYQFLQDDFDADDWNIVPDSPKTIRLMSFSEAMAKVKEGHAVRRKDWIHSTVKKDKMFNIARVRWDIDSQSQRITHFIPTFEDIEATDWIVEDK